MTVAIYLCLSPPFSTCVRLRQLGKWNSLRKLLQLHRPCQKHHVHAVLICRRRRLHA